MSSLSSSSLSSSPFPRVAGRTTTTTTPPDHDDARDEPSDSSTVDPQQSQAHKRSRSKSLSFPMTAALGDGGAITTTNRCGDEKESIIVAVVDEEGEDANEDRDSYHDHLHRRHPLSSPPQVNEEARDPLVLKTRRVLANLERHSFLFAKSSCQVRNLEPKDLKLGGEIGRGEFGVILPIHSIRNCEEVEHMLSGKQQRPSSLSGELSRRLYALKRLVPDKHEHEGPDHARATTMTPRSGAAWQRLQRNQRRQRRVSATLDLACEAAYLKRLVGHAHIIHLYATVGTPGTDSYGLILERITHTLQDQLDVWRDQRHAASTHRLVSTRILQAFFTKKDASSTISRRNAALRNLGGEEPCSTLQALLRQRLQACSDLASALAYLHEMRMIHRDIKPGNVGFIQGGQLKLFDFGLAKELKPADRVLVVASKDEYGNATGLPPYEAYQATGLTGSRRYMAPEVMSCQPYSWKADVYSFAITAWEVLTLETPFPSGQQVHGLFGNAAVGGSASKLMQQVVEEAKRPSLRRIQQEFRPCLSSAQRKLLNNACGLNTSSGDNILARAWTQGPAQRCNMTDVCQVLQKALDCIHGFDHQEDELVHHANIVTDGITEVEQATASTNKNIKPRYYPRNNHTAAVKYQNIRDQLVASLVINSTAPHINNSSNSNNHNNGDPTMQQRVKKPLTLQYRPPPSIAAAVAAVTGNLIVTN